MAGFLPDTSCIVAAISSWHHQRASAEIERRLRRGDDLLLAAHSLAEAYSVLTRLPPPWRLMPQIAWRALSEGFLAVGQGSALTADGYKELLNRAAAAGIVGGSIHDAVIAACAETTHADVILTFNERHFRRFASATLQIVVPSA